MSGRSVSYPHCLWASLPEAVYPYLVPIVSLETDNLLFLNKQKREINFPRKKRVDLGILALEYKVDTYRPSFHTSLNLVQKEVCFKRNLGLISGSLLDHVYSTVVNGLLSVAGPELKGECNFIIMGCKLNFANHEF